MRGGVGGVMSKTGKSGGAGALAFSGAATVRTVETLRSALLAAMREHAAVELDCSGIDEVDVSFIQLLLAARRSAASRGQALALAHPASGALHDALTRGGFLVALDGAASGDADFWLKEAGTR